MAYTTPRTWVTGEVVTAALLNTHLRDNLNAAFPVGVDAWTSYTPTLTQSVTVTKTVTYAKYMKIGRMVTVRVDLAVTSAGTANNAIKIGLPVTAATSGNHVVIGNAWVFDASVPLLSVGVARGLTTTETDLLMNGTVGVPIGVNPNFALASGDEVAMCVTYESAT